MSAINSLKTQTCVAFAPASLSNLGPGFDSLGVALSIWHDQVHITLTPGLAYTVGFDHSGEWKGPTDPHKNTASVSALHVAQTLGYTGGASLHIKKGIRAGSGLGSSAASAVAGAMAMNGALGSPLTKSELIDACMEGESIVSGARHGDNVIPSLMGGTMLVESGNPAFHQRIDSMMDVHFAVILPDVEVLTQQARALLPASVTLKDASVWASRLSQLILAMSNADVSLFGKLVMKDDLIEPIRATLLSPYSAIKEAALKRGAKGCALSGSGPAMFAVCSSSAEASAIAESMKNACAEFGISSLTAVERINARGAYTQ